MPERAKIHIKEAIVVEGRYDKVKVSGIFDTVVVETHGFGIFSDKKQLNLIRSLARTRGIIILTDSDGAGFVIRNYLKGAITCGVVRHAYIPDIFGKERRKVCASAEGKLGVEGIPDDIIAEAVKSAGAEPAVREDGKKITKVDLFEDGLNGCPDSAARRAVLLRHLSLPEHLSVNALCDVLNSIMTVDQYKDMLKKILPEN